jgi:RHS repeat-associated protein
MLSAGGTNYYYDNNGNQVTKTEQGKTTEFSYDTRNRLIKINYNDGSTNQFEYNVAGQRIAKSDNAGTTYFVYDGPNILMETNEDGLVKANYVNGILGGGVLYKRNSTDVYTYFMKDVLDSITQMTDDVGNIVVSYSYDIFGALRSKIIFDDRGIKQTFAGKEMDDDSGLIYFGVRYYAPQSGRFISPDSWTYGPDDIRTNGHLSFGKALSFLGQLDTSRLNSYVYVFNNPIRNADIDGHGTLWGTILAWLAVILAVATVIAKMAGAAALLTAFGWAAVGLAVLSLIVFCFNPDVMGAFLWVIGAIITGIGLVSTAWPVILAGLIIAIIGLFAEYWPEEAYPEPEPAKP